MIRERLDKVIRTVPDFPKKGIDFKDITSILLDDKLSNEIVQSFSDKFKDIDFDAIIGIESRGFLFGFLLANKLGVPFIPVRKAGKLPGKTIKYKYDLEYGSSEIEIHCNDIQEGWNILIHDDLLATGGTASAAAELVLKSKANVAAFAFIVNLAYLDGQIQLDKYTNNIISLTNY
ncbi:MAG: adenine phosphoribosyltransferase [Flavobacteriales bacterium]|nr:adenine phosphoribosyltransferase [Flavobacteriales bacterium]